MVVLDLGTGAEIHLPAEAVPADGNRFLLAAGMVVAFVSLFLAPGSRTAFDTAPHTASDTLVDNLLWKVAPLVQSALRRQVEEEALYRPTNPLQKTEKTEAYHSLSQKWVRAWACLHLARAQHLNRK